MDTITISEQDCNSLRTQLNEKLIADGVTSEKERNSIIEKVIAQLERDRETAERKASVTAQLESIPPAPSEPLTEGQKRILASMRWEVERDRNQDAKERKAAEQRRFRYDRWQPLNKRDAERFAKLGIDTRTGGLESVAPMNRHDAIVALLYHTAKYEQAIGNVTGETDKDSLAQVLYKYVWPISSRQAYKSPDEVDKLALTVANNFLKNLEKHNRDDDAARRGGLKSGQVRRDRTEERLWKKVIALKATGMKNVQIARELDIHRNTVTNILKSGIRFSGGKTKFK